jgi:hypothetical protein
MWDPTNYSPAWTVNSGLIAARHRIELNAYRQNSQDLVVGEFTSIPASMLGFLPSLDYFVRPCQHIRRNRQADFPRSTEVKH